MKNKVEEMRSAYGLSEEGSLLIMLDDFKDEDAVLALLADKMRIFFFKNSSNFHNRDVRLY